MTPYILIVLGLYFVQVMLPVLFVTLGAPDRPAAINDHLRAKDNAPTPSKNTARLQRAQGNLTESLPIFIALALLHEIHGTTEGLAADGALVFIAARFVYVPVYMLAVPGLRSAVWAVSAFGLAMMATAAA